MKPYEWQKKDLNDIIDSNFVSLLNIQMGGGKTPLATWSMGELQPDLALIVAPLSTFESAWIPTIRKLLGIEARPIGNGNKAQKDALADFEWQVPGVYLVTPQLLTRSAASHWQGDLLIVDEVHLLSNPGSKGQRALSGFSVKDEPIGRNFPHRLALSGTPFRNKFVNSWSLMRLLWPELYRRGEVAHNNYYLWRKDRVTQGSVVTGSEWVPYEVDGARSKMIDGRRHWQKLQRADTWTTELEPGRLINEAPSVVQHFRRHKCCLWHPDGFLDHDAPQEIERVVPLHPTQRKAIAELEKHYMTFLDDKPLMTDLTITQQQRIREVCLGVPTIEWTTDEETGEETMHLDWDVDCISPFYDELTRILEGLDDGEPVTVFLNSQKFARVLTQRLNKDGWSAFEYSGQVNKRERAANLANFGKPGGHQVLVGQLQSIGTGTDGIQRVCNTEVWLESSTDPTVNEQSRGRTDRMGSRGQVQRYILLDENGYAKGRYGKELTKLLAMRKMTTRDVQE